MGRPAYEITPDVIRKTESLASQGLTKEQIARVLGISYQTLNEKTKAFPEFSEAIKTGQAKGVATITNALFNNAKDGNITAQIFYLKNRAPDEWMDVKQIDARVRSNDPNTIPSEELDRLIYDRLNQDAAVQAKGKKKPGGVRKVH